MGDDLIKCNFCKDWIHRVQCCLHSTEEFLEISKNEKTPWCCPKCAAETLKELWLNAEKEEYEISIDILKQFTFLRVLRLQKYSTKKMVEIIKFYMEIQSTHWLLLMKYITFSDEIVEVVEYYNSFSHLKDKGGNKKHID